MALAPDPKDWESYSKIDPELESILPKFAGFKLVEPGVTTVEAIRAPGLKKPPTPLVPGVSETDIEIPVRDGTSNTARVYASTSHTTPTGPLAVFAYGGGYVVGKLGLEEQNCRAWVKNHGGVAIGISYRLCPEHKWPGPQEDMYDAVKWIGRNAEKFGADPEMGFVLGGTSAGATGMITVTYMLRDEGFSPKLTGLYLAVPAACVVSSIPAKYRDLEKSWEQNEDAPLYNRIASDWFAGQVKADPKDELRSPMLWSTGHHNLPPTYFAIAGADLWRDCGLIYELILRENGVKTMVDVFQGLPHAFWTIVPTAKFALDYREKAEEGLKWLLEQSI